MNRLVCILAVMGFGLATVAAQGSRADYDRAESLRRLTEGKVLNQQLTARWLPDNRHFWYRRESGAGRSEFILVNVEMGEKQPAFDHAKLATALQKASGRDVSADKLSLDGLTFSSGTNTFQFRFAGKGWEFKKTSGALSETKLESATADGTLPAKADAPRASTRTGAETEITFLNKTAGAVSLFWLSTDGERLAYGQIAAGEQRSQHTFAGHVWIAMADGKTMGVFEATDKPAVAEITGQTTTNANPNPPSRGRGENRRSQSRGQSPNGEWTASIRDYNVVIRSTNQSEIALTKDATSEDPYTNEFYWSPDSQKLVTLRTIPGQEHKVYLIESSPKDQLQPKLHNFDYQKPGDKLPHPRPQLFDIATKQQIPISDELFPNPWSLNRIRWETNSSRFTFLYNQRGHQVLRIVSVDAQTGAARAIVDEQSKTFIDYSGKLFTESLPDTDELIWMSERDRWNHLYLYDARSGQVKN
ncbi:MAG: DPP IV N-terminal domain-containing protein, partial [Akkermansiaceae bacterium]|nr:DPP IV N-terminal domain-containing protein [Verrucomicrobiales bacterium]